MFYFLFRLCRTKKPVKYLFFLQNILKFNLKSSLPKPIFQVFELGTVTDSQDLRTVGKGVW